MARRSTMWTATMLSVTLAVSILGLPQGAVARDSEGVPDVVVRYAPLVYLHPGEMLTPYPADIYCERATEVRFGDDHYLEPGEDVGTRTLAGSAPAYYEYVPGRYIIYWFFYSLDRQELPLSVLTRPLFEVDTVKEHDGDWEHIVVRLDEHDEPTDIAYYQHACEPRIFGWAELSGHEPFGPYSGISGGTHPIVYSALGSHASYWGPRGRLEPMGVRCPELPDQIDDIRFDVVEKGDAWKTWEGMGLMDARAEDWYHYTGIWGPPDAELLSLTPDLAPWFEYLDYSSGGRGPGADRLGDVVPKGWDAPSTSASLDASWTVTVARADDGWISEVSAGEAGSFVVALGIDDTSVRKYSAVGRRWLNLQVPDVPDWSLVQAADDNGDVFIAGATDGALPGQTSRGGLDAYVRRYGADGQVAWTRQFGTGRDEHVASIALGSTGSAYVLGITYGRLQGKNRGYTDVFARKYAHDGQVVWTRQFGTLDYDEPGVIAVTPAEDVYVTWETMVDGTYLTKFSPEGVVRWDRPVETFCGYVEGAVADGDGAVYLAGTSNLRTGCLLTDEGNPMPNTAFVHKYDPGGTLLWTRKYRPQTSSSASDIALGPDGEALVAGTHWTWAGSGTRQVDSAAYVRAFHPSGEVSWEIQCRAESPSANRAYTGSLALDPAGERLYVAGSVTLPAGQAASWEAVMWVVDLPLILGDAAPAGPCVKRR